MATRTTAMRLVILAAIVSLVAADVDVAMVDKNGDGIIDEVTDPRLPRHHLKDIGCGAATIGLKTVHKIVTRVSLCIMIS